MWSSVVYLFPIATILSKVTVEDEIVMDGDLYQEFNSLICKYVPPDQFVLLPNPELKLTANLRFPKGTTLWSILDSILVRYHLTAELGTTREEALTAKLKEGAAWKH